MSGRRMSINARSAPRFMVYLKSIVVINILIEYMGVYTKMSYNESAENYLETILILSRRLPVVRAVNIATELDFKKSSVSVAMKNLREKEYIRVDESGYIFLTEKGLEIAEMIYERHQLISEWLMNLGVPEEIATEDACKMEHVISKESFDAIKAHLNISPISK